MPLAGAPVMISFKGLERREVEERRLGVGEVKAPMGKRRRRRSTGRREKRERDMVG